MGMRPLLNLLILSLGLLLTRAEQWSLPDALGFARTNAPDARIARQRILAAQAVLQQANAVFWPRMQLQSSYTRTDNPVSVFGTALNQRSYSPSLDFNNVPDADNLNMRGLLTVPLYSGGRNSAGRNAARAGSRAARAESEAVRNTLEFEVARAFYTILKTRRFVEAAESAVRSFETNRFTAEKRFNAGTILKTELLDIDVRLGQAREDLVRARNATTLALVGFKNLLGLEDREVEIIDSSAEEPLGLPIVLPTGGAVRPELKAIASQQQAAEANVRQAKSGYLPRVDAFGQVDHDSGWKFDGSGKSYAVGVMAQWDLWDGQATRGRVSEARAILEQLREEERKLRLALELEAEHARLNLIEADERLAVTEQTIKQAKESLNLTQSRFEQGLALSTQLIDAETALTAARMRRAEAEADRRIAVAAIRKAYGLSQLEGR